MSTKDDHLNLTNIKYFCDTVRLGGLSAAARANFVTQSAISQGISKLEKSLGIPLVAHHPNRFRLTPEGEIVFQEGIDLLKKAAEFKKNLFREATGCIGSLDFACTYSFALAVVPRFLKKFREKHPEVKVNFLLDKNANIKQMVKLGAIDFGILPDEGDLEGFDKEEICSGNFNLYASRKIKDEDLHSLGFVLAANDAKETILLKNLYKKKYGKEPTGILEVNSWEVIANLVAEGMGIGYFPDYIAERRENTFQICDFGLELQGYRICSISPIGMKLRKSSEIFLSYLRSK